MIALLNNDPGAKKVFDEATGKGVKIIAGNTDTGGMWSPIENGGKGLIRIDPPKTTSRDHATDVLLF